VNTIVDYVVASVNVGSDFRKCGEQRLNHETQKSNTQRVNNHVRRTANTRGNSSDGLGIEFDDHSDRYFLAAAPCVIRLTPGGSI
jgi:hypothetical protein